MAKITVRTEDTLTNLVFLHYGNLDFLDEIMELNRKILGEFGLHIPPGQSILLPDFEPKISSEEADLWTK